MPGVIAGRCTGTDGEPVILEAPALADSGGQPATLYKRMQLRDEMEPGHFGDDDPEWTYWLSRDEITVMAARCWTRLGQPGKAAPLIAAALTRYGPGADQGTSPLRVVSR